MSLREDVVMGLEVIIIIIGEDGDEDDKIWPEAAAGATMTIMGEEEAEGLRN
jgi:hypothetical protein